MGNRLLMAALHQVVRAISDKEAKEFAEKFQDSKPTQEDLQLFVDEKGFDKVEIDELMYDLNKEGIRTLDKPDPVEKDLSEETFDLDDIEVGEMSDLNPPRFEDAWVSSAYWKSTENDLTDDELEYLNSNYSEWVNAKAEEWYY